ncbi:MAG: GNAT family N-acetyltransferase [Ruminococcus flavefaciens]|nr:GNAT family N-acetyltransferase [Ruminococcus flavefaciens]
MYFKKLNRNSKDIPLLEKLNSQAFPKNERIDIDDMFCFPEESGREVIGIYTEDEFSGFIITIKLIKCVYICYLAVCPEKRSQGIGGQALKMLKEYYPDCQIVVDFEAPDENSENNQQRIRRRNFYYRNGFFATGYYQFYMETEFEIACSETDFDKAGFEILISEIHKVAPDFNPKLYRKN